jgi:hypothetical protein
MSFPGHRALQRFFKFFPLVVLVTAAAAGCTGSNRKTPEQQLDEAFKNNPEFKRLQLAKFQGHVTIDGQPPEPDSKLFIVLLDAEKFQDPKAPSCQARVGENGDFSFMTYLKDDGAPVGKWVAVFVDPRSDGTGVNVQRIGQSGLGGGRFIRPISGPDALKNLYNDPEKNLKDPAFVVNLQAPGITDQTFSLQVAGKDPPPGPGPHAVTKIVDSIANVGALK